MNLLQLVQAATGEMGLPVPTYVAGNPATDTIQQMALLNAAGSEISRKHLWEQMVREYVFDTVGYTYTGDLVQGSYVIQNLSSTTGLDTTYTLSGDGVAQSAMVSSVDSPTQVTMTLAATASGTQVSISFGKSQFTLPADYDRQIDRTHWDKSKRWELLGPETAQQWQWLKCGWISTGPRIRYRIFAGFFQIWPVVTNTDVLAFEYMSKSWASSALGVPQTQFLMDMDTCIYPDRLMILALKKKYFEVKGMDTAFFERDYEFELNLAKTSDAGSPTLSMAPRFNNVLIGYNNLPDSGYGVPS